MTDEDFLWTEKLAVPEGGWVPQGTLIITSGKKLQMPDREEPND